MEESQLIQFNLNIHCHPSIKSDMRQHSKYLRCFYQLLLWYFEIFWVVWDIVIRAKYYKICKRNWKGISKLLLKYQILERLNLVHRDIPKMGRWRLPASDWDKFLNYNWVLDIFCQYVSIGAHGPLFLATMLEMIYWLRKNLLLSKDLSRRPRGFAIGTSDRFGQKGAGNALSCVQLYSERVWVNVTFINDCSICIMYTRRMWDKTTDNWLPADGTQALQYLK